ncbi:hypothetical protein RA265_30810, partial [Pseudomonas syringae pv. tagetis]|uniref:hypothetical protein n=1 Tax=Pseudomonas syringae group genomosp. 7 TaxID=251699 RepID=UPI003770008C
WFLSLMEGGNEAYNIPLALSLRGSLDGIALSAAVARIVERHETLLSRFMACEEGADVLFSPPSDLPFLNVEDLRKA